MSTKKPYFTSAKLFVCEKCDFKCCKKGDYTRHLATLKHINQQVSTQKPSNNITCECGKQYKDRSGLWRHKKACKYEDTTNNLELNKDALILKLLQQNEELHNLVIKINQN
jgi:hypothetical protein